jgi:hypothetical protein
MRILLILLLSFITGLQIEAKAKHQTTKDLNSADIAESIIGQPAKLRESFQYEQGNLVAQIFSLGTTRQPKEVLLIWNKESDQFTLAGKRESFSGETFEKPLLFEVNNYKFLNISTEPSGSGAFVSDIILWLAPDHSTHEVDFEQASVIYESRVPSDQVVLSGGEKEFFFEENQMAFQFWIAQQGDPHCCPSGGTVQGTYKLEGAPKFDSFSKEYTADFRITVDQMQHAPNPATSIDYNQIAQQ